MTEILVLVLFGVLGGFISGLLGVGGGIIFVPVITAVLAHYGVSDSELAKFVLANSFAATFFAGAISTYKQYKLKSFYPKEIAYTAAAAIPASLLVSYLITKGTWYNKQSFGIFFVVLLTLMLIKFISSKSIKGAVKQNISSSKYAITGAFSGMVSALSGLGGGVIMVPAFTQYLKLDIKKAASISIGTIPFLMIPMILVYIFSSSSEVIHGSQLGYLLPTVFLPLVGGLLFAAPLGVSASKKIHPNYLKIIFAGLIIIVIIKTIIYLV